jgi:hypothetical protein
MKDAHNQNAIIDLAVENRMTAGFYFSVAGPDMARITPNVGKFRQHLERPMYSQNISFSASKSPLSQRAVGNSLNGGVCLTR